MIVIVSNGASYSDHRVYFVDTTDSGISDAEAVAHVTEFLQTARQSWDPDERVCRDGAKVLGTAQGIEWFGTDDRSQWRTIPLEKFKTEACNDGFI